MILSYVKLQTIFGESNMNKIPKIPEVIKNLARHAYPDYTGRKIYWKKWDGKPIDCVSYWDEGTRTYFKFVLADGKTFEAPPNTAPWVQHKENREAVLVPGLCCITHAIFCGHECGLTVIMHENDFPKMLEDNTKQEV